MRKSLLVLLLVICLLPTPVRGAESFKQRELNIVLSDDFTSKAILTSPVGTGKSPLLILFHGSGPYGMDASYRVTPDAPILSANFKLIAETLPESGISVLRFNKRGVAADGTIDWAQVQKSTLDQLVSDANAVLEAALKMPEVDTSRIYLYGWSEGSWVIANVAQTNKSVSGLIMQGAPNGSVTDLLPYQWKELAIPHLTNVIDTDKDGKLSLAEIQKIKLGSTQYMGTFMFYDLQSTPEKPLISTYTDKDKDGLIDIQKELIPVIDMFLGQMAAFMPRVKASYKLDELITAFDKPTLVLHGSLDGWSPLSQAQKLESAGATVIVYEGLGHALSKTELPAEDGFGIMEDQPLKDLTDWITAHAK